MAHVKHKTTVTDMSVGVGESEFGELLRDTLHVEMSDAAERILERVFWANATRPHARGARRPGGDITGLVISLHAALTGL